MSWNKTHLPAAMHWGKESSSTWVSVCSAKAFCVHVPTLLCKENHFSYSLYIAQTRYTKYWSTRGVCVSHPTLPTTIKQWKHNSKATQLQHQTFKQLDSALQLTVVTLWMGSATEMGPVISGTGDRVRADTNKKIFQEHRYVLLIADHSLWCYQIQHLISSALYWIIEKCSYWTNEMLMMLFYKNPNFGFFYHLKYKHIGFFWAATPM